MLRWGTVILTEEQAKARVNSEGNLLNRFGRKETPAKVVEITPTYRKAPGGTVGFIPEDVKVEVAARARLGEDQKALAQEFGMSVTTARYLEHGDGYRGKPGADERAIEKRMDEIQDKALCKLMASLGFLDDEKLSKMSGKDLASVAANMAKVAGNVRPSQGDGNAVHLHLYAPELRKEQNYKTIEVSSL